jgi:hypothetical protein
MKLKAWMSRRVGLGLLGVLLLGALAVVVMRSGVDAAARSSRHAAGVLRHLRMSTHMRNQQLAICVLAHQAAGTLTKRGSIPCRRPQT